MKENEVILHEDYSASYNSTQQDEIQSAYFGKSKFSIFTASGYIFDYRKEFSQRSVPVFSEWNTYSRIAALTCVDMVLKEIEKKHDIRKFMVWSDACTSHFRSRFVFKLLSSIAQKFF